MKIPIELVVNSDGKTYLNYWGATTSISAELRGRTLYLENYDEMNDTVEYKERISLADFIVRVANEFAFTHKENL